MASLRVKLTMNRRRQQQLKMLEEEVSMRRGREKTEKGRSEAESEPNSGRERLLFVTLVLGEKVCDERVMLMMLISCSS